MTREYARVKVSIWADTDFRKLTDRAQSLYFRLLSSPTMNLCGVADWRPKRIAALTAGMTPAMVEEAAAELSEHGYVVVDETTEEVLIRSFVRHDGLIKTPNIAASMAKDYAGTASATIRGVIVHELLRMKAEEPGMKGWATASHLLSEPEIDPSAMPSFKASPMPSVEASVTPLPMPSGNGSHIPQPSSLNQQPSSPTGDAAQKRGHRLPKGWMPDEEVIEAMRNECPNVDLTAEHRKFTDHWNAKTGRDAAKLDWNATWRNWIRNARPSLGARRPGNDIDWDAAAARAAAADAARAV